MLKIKKIDAKNFKSSIVIEIFLLLLASFSSTIAGFFFMSDLSSLDWRLNIREKYYLNIDPNKDQNIVIVYISKNLDLREKNNTVTNRNHLTKLIKKISQFNPKVIAFDYIFELPSNDLKHDSELEETFNKLTSSGEKVIIGYRTFLSIKNEEAFETATQRKFYNSCYSAGYLNIIKDEAGITRYFRFTNNGMASFVHEIVSCYKGLPSAKSNNIKSSINTIKGETRKILIREYGNALYYGMTMINFYISQLDKLFNIYSSEDILSASKGETLIFQNQLKDKIVLIGSVGPSEDIHKTPLFKKSHGVLIQATILKNFIDKQFISYIPKVISIAIVIALSFIAILISLNFGIFKINLYISALLVLYYLSSLAFFISSGILLPSLSATLSILISALIILYLRIVLSENDTDELDFKIFKFLSNEYMRNLIKRKKT